MPRFNRLLPVVLLFVVLPVRANWYQVEVVIFEHRLTDTDGEVWYENPGLPDRVDSIGLITETVDDPAPAEENGDAARLIPYRALDPGRNRLGGVVRVLELNRSYRPLLHVSWQQPGASGAAARSVHLELFRDEGDAAAADGAPVPAYAVAEALLDGTVRLRVSRFLHVDVDMAFFPEPGEQSGAPSVAESAALRADYVRLRESRKIRLNELHYFDHPLFGVILQVSRLQPPDGVEAD